MRRPTRLRNHASAVVESVKGHRSVGAERHDCCHILSTSCARKDLRSLRRIRKVMLRSETRPKERQSHPSMCKQHSTIDADMLSKHRCCHIRYSRSARKDRRKTEMKYHDLRGQTLFLAHPRSKGFPAPSKQWSWSWADSRLLAALLPSCRHAWLAWLLPCQDERHMHEKTLRNAQAPGMWPA